MADFLLFVWLLGTFALAVWLVWLGFRLLLGRDIFAEHTAYLKKLRAEWHRHLPGSILGRVPGWRRNIAPGLSIFLVFLFLLVATIMVLRVVVRALGMPLD